MDDITLYPSFLNKVLEARETNQQILCFLCPTCTDIEMYFVRDILNENIDLEEYDYSQTNAVEYATLKIGKDNPKVIRLHPVALEDLINRSLAIDYGTSSDEIYERFVLYSNYFVRFSSTIKIDMLLRLYQYSIDTQRMIAKEDFGISLNKLYNTMSILRIDNLEQSRTLNEYRSLKYNYIGLIYINIYTFDLFIQVHHHPNIDTLLAGVTNPDVANFLVHIEPGDSIEQVIAAYLRLQVDLRSVIQKQPIQQSRKAELQ